MQGHIVTPFSAGSEVAQKRAGGNMSLDRCKSFFKVTLALIAFSGFAWAYNHHHELNGTWKLTSTRSQFHGEPVLQKGTITIQDHDHNIYINRDFNFEGGNQAVSYSSTLEGRTNSPVYQAGGLETMIRWQDGVLTATSKQNGATTAVQQFQLTPDGDLMLTVNRPGHQTEVLYFERA
jgi:hypothetical protein